MSDPNKEIVDDGTTAAVLDTDVRVFLDHMLALMGRLVEDMSRKVAKVANDTATRMLRDLASGALEENDAQREVLDALMKRAMQAEPPDPDEAEALALLDGFDGRIADVERRIDRVIARLDAG